MCCPDPRAKSTKLWMMEIGLLTSLIPYRILLYSSAHGGMCRVT